ncbi:MAG: glycosyltransferase [Limisphaerales bacterium]
MNQTLIIVPTYNERENLPRIAAKLLSLPVSVDLLVVDDNSPDGTGKIADELAAQHPQIKVLHRAGKEGLGRAYIAGFNWALAQGYEFILRWTVISRTTRMTFRHFLKPLKMPTSCWVRATSAASVS